MMNKKNIIIIITISILLIAIIYLFLNKQSTMFNTGVLIVKTTPSDSKVIIGAKEYKDNEEIKLSAGSHTFNIKKEGYNTSKDYFVDIKDNETTSQEVKLIKELSFEEKNLIKILPRENENYGIFFTVSEEGALEITIRLYTIVNGHPGEELYIKQQLAEYKKEALRWITSQSIATETLNIKYVPEEASSL